LSAFIDACFRKETERTPAWFMRQAGRYLPSYRKLKGSKSVLDIAKDPELASRAVVEAVRDLGVDAGIIFADIMIPLEGMGVRFSIEENLGPVVSNPIRSASDVDRLSGFNKEGGVARVYDAIDETVRKLDGTPLIGFSGAPFTLAGYIIEGVPSRELERTKTMMYNEPEVWTALMGKLTRMVKLYLRDQIAHGVNAVQLFDSWVGSLSPEDYKQYVLPYTKEIFDSIDPSVPTIHFCASSSHLIEQFHSTGARVLSVDWRVGIGDVWQRCSDSVAVQGNLDPVAAVAGGEKLESEVSRILGDAEGHMGHIFSLGHGVLRDTPPENLRRVVNMVRERTRKRR
jgi:uroporphyrinogen decarboxylase